MVSLSDTWMTAGGVSLALVKQGGNEEFTLDNVNLKVSLGNTHICEYET